MGANKVMKNSILKNTIYSFLLQFTNILFPLVTAPYVSQVIGADGLGKVQFATSVVLWFSIFCLIGTNTYGVREVAKIRDDKTKLREFFSEMIILKIIASILTISVYLPSIFLIQQFSSEYILFLIQGTVLLLSIFSIDWFFQGVEDFKYITLRSLLFKIIALALIFLVVKEKDDYILYASIMIFGLSFSNILNYFYVRKYVSFSLKGLNMKRHLKPISVFFTGSLVISIYTIIDQILLGLLKSAQDVAFYARAKMFLSSSLAMSITISNVIMPRLNNYYVTNKEKYKDLLNLSVNLIFIISIPVATGICILAKWLMLLFGGHEFAPATIALIIISPLIIIIPIGTWNYSQRILPTAKEKFGMIVQLVMAILSLMLNILLIPHFGFIGAAFSLLLVESLGAIIGLIYMHKRDAFRILSTSSLIKYITAAIIMSFFVKVIQGFLEMSWLSLFICIIIGGIIYFIVLTIFKDKVTDFILKALNAKLNFSFNNKS